MNFFVAVALFLVLAHRLSVAVSFSLICSFFGDVLLVLTALFFFYRFYKCSLRLADILVRPTQRLTKYGLLLGAIRKHVVDENDAESLDLMVCVVGVSHFLLMQTHTHAQQHELQQCNTCMYVCVCACRVVNEYCFYAQESNYVTNENPLAFY